VGIVKTEFGYHVIELKKRTDYKEAAKDDIAKGILIYKMTQWEKDKKYEVIKDKTALDKISLG
jgi:parvulin-like peptidyl-prolyl isomerase